MSARSGRFAFPMGTLVFEDLLSAQLRRRRKVQLVALIGTGRCSCSCAARPPPSILAMKPASPHALSSPAQRRFLSAVSYRILGEIVHGEFAADFRRLWQKRRNWKQASVLADWRQYCSSSRISSSSSTDSSDGFGSYKALESSTDGIRNLDGSTDREKFTDGSTDREKFIDGSTDREKFIDGSTTREKFIDGSTDRENFIHGSTDREKFIDGSTDREKFIDGSTDREIFLDGSMDRGKFIDGSTDGKRILEGSTDGDGRTLEAGTDDGDGRTLEGCRDGNRILDEGGRLSLPQELAMEENLEDANRPTVYDSLNIEMVTVEVFPELNFSLSGNFYPKLVPLIARKIVEFLDEADAGGSDDSRDRIGDLLKELGVKLSPHIVAEVIKQLRNPVRAKTFFEWAETQDDFQGNSHTYNQILWSVVNERTGFPSVGYVCHLVQEMLARELKPSPRACNLLVDRLCKDAQIDGALKMVKACQTDHFPDVVTYNSIINGLGKLGLFREAFEQFQRMKQKGCSPNVITYNSVINALTKAGLMSQVFELLNEMSTSGGCAPDRITYNTLIYGLCNAGQWKEALEIWDQFPQRDILPDVVTYNSLISGLFKCQRPSEALAIFRALGSGGGCKPDLITFNTVIDGLMQAGLTDEAWKVLHAIEEQGWTANEITYNAMIIGLVNNNQRFEVPRLVELMREKGCKPSGFAQRLLGSARAENGGGRDTKGALHRDGKPRIKMPS